MKLFSWLGIDPVFFFTINFKCLLPFGCQSKFSLTIAALFRFSPVSLSFRSENRVSFECRIFQTYLDFCDKVVEFHFCVSFFIFRFLIRYLRTNQWLTSALVTELFTFLCSFIFFIFQTFFSLWINLRQF